MPPPSRIEPDQASGGCCNPGLAAALLSSKVLTAVCGLQPIALAAVGLLLIIATQWDSLGEGSQRCRMTG